VYRPMAGYLSMSIASSGAGGGKPSKAVQRWVTLEPHGMRLSVRRDCVGPHVHASIMCSRQ
jgi:hypothetical protein